MQINKKIVSICFVLFLSKNSYACCGCAIVEASMQTMSETFEMSMSFYDEKASTTYENDILAKINNILVNLNTNFNALKANTLLEGNLGICGDEISHEIKKSIELKNIEKTQKAILEFEK